MANSFIYKELAERYGLPPLPESVLQLTRLVAQQEADLDELAGLIFRDPALARRLIRASAVRVKNDMECGMDAVKEALMHSGTRCVLLMAMGGLLTLALTRTFRIMMDLELENVPIDSAPPFAGEYLLCSISFTGKADGKVFLRMNSISARRTAAAMLRCKPELIVRDAEINDAIGELLNIVTGNLNSNLCDAGVDCRLHTPSVRRVKRFKIKTVHGGGWERAAFRAPGISLFADLTVNPWHET